MAEMQVWGKIEIRLKYNHEALSGPDEEEKAEAIEAIWDQITERLELTVDSNQPIRKDLVLEIQE